MISQKKIISLVLASSMIISLAGCSNATTTDDTSSTESTTSMESTSSTETMSPETEQTAISETLDTTDSTDATMSTDAMQGGAGGAGGGAVDKSSDEELQSMISELVDKFDQYDYTDEDTGLSVSYNLYLPDDYDASKTYPMVVFIADSSVVGQETTAPLTQGYGGLIWASDEDQAKHESIVLVPEYPEVILDDHGSYTMTDYVELTKRLIDSVSENYAVDTDRIYATGQSMGCMTLMYLASEYSDLFAAEMFVDGQWDTSVLAPLADQTFFYFAAEGDESAYTGMQDLIPIWEDAGASISTAEWDAQWSDDEFDDAVSSILSEDNPINCVTWLLGSVLPDGVEIGTSEHMYSFDYAYKVDGVRDWLFEQSK